VLSYVDIISYYLVNKLKFQKVVKREELVKFEVLTSTSINITIFWHVMPCSLVGWPQNSLSISRVASDPATWRYKQFSIESLVQCTISQGTVLQHIMCVILERALSSKLIDV
jgi:hypothetical protein